MRQYNLQKVINELVQFIINKSRGYKNEIYEPFQYLFRKEKYNTKQKQQLVINQTSFSIYRNKY